MESMIIPISVCVILPVLVVWITSMRLTNRDNRRAEVLMEAIKSNNGIDADKLAKALATPRKDPMSTLNGYMLKGSIFTLLGVAVTVGYLVLSNVADSLLLLAFCSIAVGISYMFVYFVNKKQVSANNEE